MTAHSGDPEGGSEPMQPVPANPTPVGGRIAFTHIGPEPLDVDEHARAVNQENCGAVITFAGVVRNIDSERAVTAIEYVAHPSAAAVLDQVVTEVFSAGACAAAAVSHRTGHLEVGDIAFVVAVAAEHRKEAFETTVNLVDEVKALLPVWKRQIFTDGRDEWVGSA